MSELPAIPEIVGLPERPTCDYPPSEGSDMSSLAPVLLGLLGSLASGILCFGIVPKLWWLIFLLLAAVLFGAIKLYRHNRGNVDSWRAQWHPYEQQVKTITTESTEQASKTWLPVLNWWETPSKHSLTVVFLNGAERVAKEFPIEQVEKIHANVKAVRFPNVSYSKSSDQKQEAILSWGYTLWLYDPSFPLPIPEQPTFSSEITAAVAALTLPDQTAAGIPQGVSVKEALGRLDTLIGSEVSEDGVPAAIQILEILAERMRMQPSLESEVRALIALLNQVRADRDTAQIILALRTLKERISTQASMASAEVEVGQIK